MDTKENNMAQSISDEAIVELYFQRNEEAIVKTDAKYGKID